MTITEEKLYVARWIERVTLVLYFCKNTFFIFLSEYFLLIQAEHFYFSADFRLKYSHVTVNNISVVLTLMVLKASLI